MMKDYQKRLIEAIIDRFEEDQAVLRINKQNLSIKKSQLPPEIKEGDSLKLVVLSDSEASREKNELAKEILNKILKDSN